MVCIQQTFIPLKYSSVKIYFLRTTFQIMGIEVIWIFPPLFLLHFIFHFIKGLVREIFLPCGQLQPCLCFQYLISHFYSVPFVKYFYTFLSAHITMFCVGKASNKCFCVKWQILWQKKYTICGTWYNLICPLSCALSSDKYNTSYINHTCLFKAVGILFLQTCLSFQ